VPPHSISQSRSAELSADLVHGRQSKVLQALYRRAGVKRRHSVLLEGDADSLNVQSFYVPAKDADDRGPSTDQRMERYAAEAPLLAAEACRKAIQQAGILPESITHLITVSCSGFYQVNQ